MSDQIAVLNPWKVPVGPGRPAARRQGALRRWLSAIARFFRRCLLRKQTVAMPESLAVQRRDGEFEFKTPAHGEAYNFDIKVCCSWHVKNAEEPPGRRRTDWQIQDSIERGRDWARARVEERIRPVARQFPPYRAAEAEEKLNEVVAGCLDDENWRVTIRVWVDVCEVIRKELEEEWKKRVQNVVADQWQMAHVETLRDLQEEWRKLLVAGLEGIGTVPADNREWLAPYALALAEKPEDAAGQLRKVLEDRVKQTETLLKNLGQASLDDRIDALEFAFQSETALRALLVYLGVPVPAANGTGSGATPGSAGPSAATDGTPG